MSRLPSYLKRNIRLIDIHSHVGVDPLLYLTKSFPYCNDLRRSRDDCLRVGVSHSVVFPWVTSVYYHPPSLQKGKVRVGGKVGDAPFHFENEQMLHQLYEIFPSYKNMFIPFPLVDTMRETRQQVRVLDRLLRKYPFYGLKVHPRATQVHVLTLGREGKVILDFARANNFPILIHATPSVLDPLSQITDIFQLARENPKIRFCAAHFCGFHQKLFEEADRMDNVWVDSAAMSIGCDLVLQKSKVYISGREKIPSDYRSPPKVFAELAQRYSDTFIWGSDNPAHTWVTPAQGNFQRLELWGSMEREKALLKNVRGRLLQKVAVDNALAFIEG